MDEYLTSPTAQQALGYAREALFTGLCFLIGLGAWLASCFSFRAARRGWAGLLTCWRLSPLGAKILKRLADAALVKRLPAPEKKNGEAHKPAAAEVWSGPLVVRRDEGHWDHPDCPLTRKWVREEWLVRVGADEPCNDLLTRRDLRGVRRAFRRHLALDAAKAGAQAAKDRQTRTGLLMEELDRAATGQSGGKLTREQLNGLYHTTTVSHA